MTTKNHAVNVDIVTLCL